MKSVRLPVLGIVSLLAISCAFAGEQNAGEDRFHFGIRGVYVPEFRSLASELGAEWVTIDLVWGKVERAKGEYDWRQMDKWIHAAQSVGMRPYIILKCISPWGTPSLVKWKKEREGHEVTNAALPEGEENIEAWKEFLDNAAKRYCMDSDGHMPGLKESVDYYQVGEEWPTEWFKRKSPDTFNVEEYVELVKITSQSLKAANPHARIAIAGLTSSYRAVPYADGYLSDADAGLRRGRRVSREDAKKSEMYRRIKASIDYIIDKAGPCFDIFSIHAFEEKDSFLEGKIRWLRNEMAQRGFPDKEIVLSGGCAPFTDKKDESDRIKAAPREEREGLDEEEVPHGDWSFEPWTMKRQAEFVVKMNAIAAANGVKGPTSVLGTAERAGSEEPYWTGAFIYNKLVDDEVGRKPAFYTYKLMTDKLKGFSGAERVKRDDGACAYKFIVEGKPVIVAWDNDGAAADLSRLVASKEVKITHIVTQLDGAHNPVYEKDDVAAASSVALGQSPVFIEEKE